MINEGFQYDSPQSKTLPVRAHDGRILGSTSNWINKQTTAGPEVGLIIAIYSNQPYFPFSIDMCQLFQVRWMEFPKRGKESIADIVRCNFSKGLPIGNTVIATNVADQDIATSYGDFWCTG